MPNDFVIVKGNKSNIRDDTLFLFNKGITDMAEIEGLEKLEKLQMILLRDNPIKEEEKHLLSQDAQKLVGYCQEKFKR